MPMDEINPEQFWSNFNNPEIMDEIRDRNIIEVIFDKIKYLCYTILALFYK